MRVNRNVARWRGLLAVAAAGTLCVPTMTSAQETYRRPPAVIAKVLEAPATPAVSLDPTRRTMLLVQRESLPPVADLAQPMVRVAGLRINPRTNGPHGPRRFTGLTLKAVDGGRETKVALPADADVGFPSWNADGSRFAFTLTKADGVELWAGETATGKARALSGPTLNAAAGGFQWMPDGRTLLCRFVPAGRGPAPERDPAPTGPVTQESSGRAAPVRTYQDLLQDAHDERLFEHYLTSQAALVDAVSGERRDIGAPAIFNDLDPSPSGEYILTARVVRPYSYLVTMDLFPEVVEIWDATKEGGGKLVHEVARVPLREDIPIQGVQKGPRGFQWRDTAPHTLLWVEALDGGDPKNKAPHRDRLMVLGAPFKGQAAERLRTEHRFTGVSWMDAPGLALVGEYDRDRRWSRTWLYEMDTPPGAAAAPRLVWDRSAQDRYNHPGTPLRTRLANGRSVVRVEDGAIFLAGQGATKEGDRPFLDRLTLAALASERLWRCEGECLESVVDVLSADGSRFITSYETPSEPPNFWIRDLAAGGGAGSRRPITGFEDPAPQLRSIRKELVTYARADGVTLSATMYTPPGYDPARDGRLPMLVWAYPMEFNDAGTAGQVSGSPYRFTQIGGASHLFMTLLGYAVMDGAAMPVIGDPETMNDTFVEQIVSGARAAIDKAVEMGIADRDRVAVGGHSYGAFMTANLLAHSDLFRAGIARSGAYNRTLTPFGFQGERRTYWEAVDAYTKLSPFTYADRIREPLLLIHGQLDSNPGTFPMQSERLYHAVKGHGGTVRLVELPFESHGYAARESVMHTLAEMGEWLDRHVKTAAPRPAGPPAPEGRAG